MAVSGNTPEIEHLDKEVFSDDVFFDVPDPGAALGRIQAQHAPSGGQLCCAPDMANTNTVDTNVIFNRKMVADEYQAAFEKCLRSTDPFPIDMDAAWKWVGYKSKQKAVKHLRKLNDLKGMWTEEQVPMANKGTPRTLIKMSTTAFKCFAASSRAGGWRARMQLCTNTDLLVTATQACADGKAAFVNLDPKQPKRVRSESGGDELAKVNADMVLAEHKRCKLDSARKAQDAEAELAIASRKNYTEAIATAAEQLKLENTAHSVDLQRFHRNRDRRADEVADMEHLKVMATERIQQQVHFEETIRSALGDAYTERDQELAQTRIRDAIAKATAMGSALSC